ncbi:hypothetical protein VTK56DRAFT_1040 [Thermocarpiscus australiensis]
MENCVRNERQLLSAEKQREQATKKLPCAVLKHEFRHGGWATTAPHRDGWMEGCGTQSRRQHANHAAHSASVLPSGITRWQSVIDPFLENRIWNRLNGIFSNSFEESTISGRSKAAGIVHDTTHIAFSKTVVVALPRECNHGDHGAPMPAAASGYLVPGTEPALSQPFTRQATPRGTVSWQAGGCSRPRRPRVSARRDAERRAPGLWRMTFGF